MAIGKIISMGVKALKASRKAKASRDLDARIRQIHLQRDKNDMKRFGVTDPRIKNIYKQRTENKLKRYGISSPKKTKKPKRSFKSMNPVEKAFTAAKITGRGMDSFSKKSRMDPRTKKFLNRVVYPSGAVGVASEQISKRKSKKRK